MSSFPAHILLVEDQKHDFEMARRVLEQQFPQIAISWAARGEEALALLKDEQIDVMVLDFELPGMSGLETLQSLQAVIKKLPTIFVTGNGDEETAVNALKLGARDYLVKDTFGQYLMQLPAVVQKIYTEFRQEQLQASISAAQQARDDRLRVTIASLDDLVFVIGKEDEFVSYYQPPGKHSLTAAPEFFLGQSYQQVLPDHVSQMITTAIAQAQVTEETQHFEYPLYSKTRTYWFEAKLTLRFTPAGQYDGVTIVVRDNTTRKKAESVLRSYNLELEKRVKERTHELTLANSRLKELDRLRAKLIDDMAHELRTPLTNLKLYLELLHRNQESEKAEQYFKVLFLQSERLEALVADIIKFSEVQAQELEHAWHNIVTIVENVVAAIELELQTRGTHCTIQTAVPEIPLWGNEEHLQMIVSLLLKNAVDYTDSGEIGVDLAVEKEWLVLKVSDTGIGIPEEDLAHIFDRFYRGSNVGQLSYPGSGMGLATVRELITIYQGDITVQSELGEGTVFTVRLPLNNENSVQKL